MRPLIIVTSFAALTACATPIPPSKTAADLTAAQSEFSRINALDTTIAAPQGTANFVGQIGASASVDGDSGGAFLGELELSVDFDDTAAGVTGTIDKITIFDDGDPDQDLGGSLAVTGAYNGGLSANASGTLSAVGSEGGFNLKGETDIVISMTGSLVDDAGKNTLVGTFSGGSVGDGDFDVDVTSGANFYAQ